MKNLHILVSAGGDGSYYPRFTMNDKLVADLKEAYANGLTSYDNCVGCDGDGFHYTTIKIQEDMTFESMGIPSGRTIPDDYAARFKSGDDDE